MSHHVYAAKRDRVVNTCARHPERKRGDLSETDGSRPEKLRGPNFDCEVHNFVRNDNKGAVTRMPQREKV
jgi:hypothetical protein